jgi:hypothetical protein
MVVATRGQFLQGERGKCALASVGRRVEQIGSRLDDGYHIAPVFRPTSEVAAMQQAGDVQHSECGAPERFVIPLREQSDL